LALSLGGTRAHADLLLNISQAGGPSIAINSSTGMATLSGEAASTTYTFLIDNQIVVFMTNGAGTATGTFIPSNATTSFEADGITVGMVTLSSVFGDYSITNVTATKTQSPSFSTIQDLTTNASNVSLGTAATLTITPSVNTTVDGAGSTFTAPLGNVNVTSTLAPTILLGGGTVTFLSNVNGTNVPGVALSMSTTGSTAASASVAGLVAPFPASNTLTISGLGVGGMTNISASTQISSLPEPATVTMAFSAVPLLGLAAWRRSRRKSV